ncbi:hypothetical protein FBZ96_101408 [Bradyrhizobium stylosanthis]|uniref:Uncharacterized protein n=1 Tax=Bradyrhizobium stylosanthis TaxID=1803665 RepID=A0A560EB89_9BRAD|nr:hypothetical protein FBZ96_101408 [Bradyrhizobium stylosanthis]
MFGNGHSQFVTCSVHAIIRSPHERSDMRERPRMSLRSSGLHGAAPGIVILSKL